MNTLTCFPEKPSRVSCASEPTPPDSLSLRPGSWDSVSPRLLLLLCISLTLRSTALNADCRTWLFFSDMTTTSSSWFLAGFRAMVLRVVSRPLRVIAISYVLYPIAATARVYVP